MPNDLRRLTSTWGDCFSPCWIAPSSVTGIVLSGLPGVTRLDRGSEPCVLVLGSPEDVYAALFSEAPNAE